MYLVDSEILTWTTISELVLPRSFVHELFSVLPFNLNFFCPESFHRIHKDSNVNGNIHTKVLTKSTYTVTPLLNL